MDKKILINGKDYDFELSHKLGKGGMCKIWLAYEKNNPKHIIAFKTPIESDYPRELFDNEVYVMEKIKEQFKLDETSKSNFPVILGSEWGYERYIAMTCEPHTKNISKIIKNINRDSKFLPVNYAIHIIKEIYKSVDQIHKLGYVHSDLKTENILLTRDGRIIILDFGITQKIGGNVMGGSKYYSPPEIDKEEKVDPSSDVYSIGVIFNELLTGTNKIKDIVPKFFQKEPRLIKEEKIKDLILEFKLNKKRRNYHLIDPISEVRNEDMHKGIEKIIRSSVEPKKEKRFSIKKIETELETILRDCSYPSLTNEDIVNYFEYYMNGTVPPTREYLEKKAEKRKFFVSDTDEIGEKEEGISRSTTMGPSSESKLMEYEEFSF